MQQKEERKKIKMKIMHFSSALQISIFSILLYFSEVLDYPANKSFIQCSQQHSAIPQCKFLLPVDIGTPTPFSPSPYIVEQIVGGIAIKTFLFWAGHSSVLNLPSWRTNPLSLPERLSWKHYQKRSFRTNEIIFWQFFAPIYNLMKALSPG